MRTEYYKSVESVESDMKLFQLCSEEMSGCIPEVRSINPVSQTGASCIPRHARISYWKLICSKARTGSAVCVYPFIMEEPGEQCTIVFALFVTEPASECVWGAAIPPLPPPLSGSVTIQEKTTVYCSPEIEFLDSNLTKDSRLLLHTLHSPFY